ncbi:MAG TPA: NfeD family protein [Solirubrobacteraceae bacterium]|jgi:membrane protein implicated in regulation of membrane protease activity|nr:NfeD family protein [Solirubrobacteraceae bacterium]
MHTGGLYLLPFAVGAALAAVVGLLGVGALLAAIVFLCASLIVLAALRPVAQKHRHLPAQLRTGAAALVGKRAMVLERIANDEGIGCVRIEGGEVWTARSFDDDAVIEAGQRVEVIEIKGATALVMP